MSGFASMCREARAHHAFINQTRLEHLARFMGARDSAAAAKIPAEGPLVPRDRRSGGGRGIVVAHATGTLGSGNGCRRV